MLGIELHFPSQYSSQKPTGPTTYWKCYMFVIIVFAQSLLQTTIIYNHVSLGEVCSCVSHI